MKKFPERWIKESGSPDSDLSDVELESLLQDAFAGIWLGKSVLAIIPDLTRDDPTPLLFPKAASMLFDSGVEKIDVLVAQGTHSPMTVYEKLWKTGLVDYPKLAARIDFFDHKWDDSGELASIGEIEKDDVIHLSGGLLNEKIAITVNKRVVSGDYDSVSVFSSTVPHEVAGFSGGAKYFFPGVAGPELTHATHWLGALAKIENVIGKIDTPTRRLINTAVELIKTPVVCINCIVSRERAGRLQTHAIFVGDIKTAFERAALISAIVHVKSVPRKYGKVLALLDEHYDELWVGGKASYKLGGVIADGGELLIYAPHLKHVSITHGELIEKFGYAPIESVSHMVEENPELGCNLCVAAHLAHVAYAGRTDGQGIVRPKYKITLASGLDESVCERLRLGYADHRTVDVNAFLADPDVLVVPDAGRDLYMIS